MPAALSTPRSAVSLVIPALNEADALPRLFREIEPLGLGCVIVADNGSTDQTAEIARQHGARVVTEPRRGYGAACAAGLGLLPDDCRVVAFLDADLADDPAYLPKLLETLDQEPADLVIGCRDAARQERGAMSLPQRFGNWLATTLIRLGWGYAYRDLGPMRVIRRDALERIDMQDRAFGWTVEMQLRALQLKMRVAQVSVPYRKRVGVSKISGTVRGVVLAGYYILTTIARLYLTRRV